MLNAQIMKKGFVNKLEFPFNNEIKNHAFKIYFTITLRY